ncbi:MAG: hypothetical protein LBN42_00885 [Oscillospiraceae bacterium]|jgi:hypothetical protein|nr:hypothetical protein [Oscillospiraceae bacterium]
MDNIEWICPKCGRRNNSKFCADCATPRPEYVVVQPEYTPPIAPVQPPIQSAPISKADFLNEVTAVPQPVQYPQTGQYQQPYTHITPEYSALHSSEQYAVPDSAASAQPTPTPKRKRGYKWNWIDNLLVCGIVICAVAAVIVYNSGDKDEDNDTQTTHAETVVTESSEALPSTENTENTENAENSGDNSAETTTVAETNETTETAIQDTTAETTAPPVSTSATFDDGQWHGDDTAPSNGGGANKGEWSNNGVAYSVGDTVTYNGQTWKCLTSHNSVPGTEPGGDYSNGNGYWGQA